MTEEDSSKCSKIGKVNESNLKALLSYNSAPEFIRLNPYITRGYRGTLTKKLCLESIFWWTNETVNIWSHTLGAIYFFGLMMHNHVFRRERLSWGDNYIIIGNLISFQVCMVLSSIYHIFGCSSAKNYWRLLSFDLFGVAQCVMTMYVTGIYYAFTCYKEMQQGYLITLFGIFVFAMLIQIPVFNVTYNIKLIVFAAWVVFGGVPTVHYVVLMGGLEHPTIVIFLSRILVVYLIIGFAFLIYMTRFPERFLSGFVDYVGWSHQWWHLLIIILLQYWYNTAIIFVDHRQQYGSPANSRFMVRLESISHENICEMEKKAWPLSWYHELPFYADQDLARCIVENPFLVYTRLKHRD